ncbi:MAG: hypothetical protein ACRDZU_05175 [Acidimicrobiales bacterium]
MTDPELATAPVDATSEEPTGSARGPGFVLAVGLAVLLAVVAGVLAVVVLTQDDGQDDLDELRQVAGRFGEVLVTYDYHDPDAHKDAVLELASGSFRQDYEDAFDRGLGQIITQVQAVSHGTVNDVFLSSVDGGQAQAVVSLDVEVSGTSGRRTLLDQYVLLTLIQLDDGWKVDDVIDLSFPTTASGAPTASTETTTTTAASAPTSVP